MIAFRHTDPRFPFLREDMSQPAGRWNAAGELTHYFCDTSDGAWAEFLRHEEIDDPEDVLTIRRALWAVEIGDTPVQIPDLSSETMTGGPETWSEFQAAARQQRMRTDGFTAQSAALRQGGAHGWQVDRGLQPGPERNGRVLVLFGTRPGLVGWAATVYGRPGVELLADVKHF